MSPGKTKLESEMRTQTATGNPHPKCFSKPSRECPQKSSPKVLVGIAPKNAQQENQRVQAPDRVEHQQISNRAENPQNQVPGRAEKQRDQAPKRGWVRARV